MKRYITLGESEPPYRPAAPSVIPALILVGSIWWERGWAQAMQAALALAPCTRAVITNWFPGREWKDG